MQKARPGVWLPPNRGSRRSIPSHPTGPQWRTPQPRGVVRAHADAGNETPLGTTWLCFLAVCWAVVPCLLFPFSFPKVTSSWCVQPTNKTVEVSLPQEVQWYCPHTICQVPSAFFSISPGWEWREAVTEGTGKPQSRAGAGGYHTVMTSGWELRRPLYLSNEQSL